MPWDEVDWFVGQNQQFERKPTVAWRGKQCEYNILLYIVAASVVQRGEPIAIQHMTNVLKIGRKHRCRAVFAINNIDKDKRYCESMASAAVCMLESDDWRRHLLTDAHLSFEHTLEAALHVPALAAAFIATECFTRGTPWMELKQTLMKRLANAGGASLACVHVLPVLSACQPELNHLPFRAAQVQELAGYSTAALIAAMLIDWQRVVLDACLALAPLNIPPYVMLEILDWLPALQCVIAKEIIDLIVRVKQSVDKLRKTEI